MATTTKRKSASLRKEISDTSPSGVEKAEDNVARIAIDEDGQIVYASALFCEISDNTQKDLQQCDYSAVLRFANEEILFQPLEAINAGCHYVYLGQSATPLEFHFDWLTTADKRRFFVGSYMAEPASKASLKAVQDRILQNDTRSKKQATASEKQKNTSSNLSPDEDFNAFAAISSDIMMVFDEQGKILRANPAFAAQLGYDQSTGMSFFDLFGSDDVPHAHNALRSLTLDKTDDISPVIDFESCVMTKDGGKRHVIWSQQKRGDVFYCIGRDITDSKSHEKEMQRREQQLSEAESIGRMGHWHWSVGQDEVQWSDQIYRIFGVEKRSFTPTLQSMNAMINRRDIGRVNQAFQRAIIEQNNYDMEFRIKRPDGQICFIRCEGRCALDDEGDVIALYGIMQDMTERIAYEKQLMEAKDAAERAYAAKSQFLANMSHELRTPLNAIIGFSEMMKSQLLGPIGNEKYLDYIGGIHESGEHLLDLISDILDMSKIEAGKYDLDFEGVNMAKIISLALQMVESRAHESGIKLCAPDNLDENLKIIADRRGVLQILLNLLSNAVKFSKEGCEVRVECLPREDYLALKVIDNGIGIPPNKLQTITRPFEQASSQYTRDHEGSGLGLAITKELIEMHGGIMNIESVLGEGTSVTVRMPYNAHEATNKGARRSTNKAA